MLTAAKLLNTALAALTLYNMSLLSDVRFRSLFNPSLWALSKRLWFKVEKESLGMVETLCNKASDDDVRLS